MIEGLKSSARCALGALALVCLVSPAHPRQWARNPSAVAQDYLVINDNRGGGETVLMLWMAPPMMPSGPATKAAAELLDKYVVLGVVHSHGSKEER